MRTEKEIVKEWMENEKVQVLSETQSKKDARFYLCSDANSECNTNLTDDELYEIANEVLGIYS